MSRLSERDLLERLSDFPKHELSIEKRLEIVRMISEQRPSKKWNVNFQQIAALAAMFILVVIAPILYFSSGEGNPQKPDTASKEVLQAEEPVYFALDDSGTPIYGDSNIGIPNKISLLAPKEWIADDHRSVSKIMIFLWGDQVKPGQILNIEAVHLETGVKENLDNAALAAGMYGADAHVMTSLMPFKRHGTYNLKFKVDNKEVGEFSIHVKEPYVLIGNSTLLLSQEDLYSGFYEDVNIEVVGDNLPEEIEMELFNFEDGEITACTFKDKTDYTTTDGKKISMYTGDFYLKKSGKYRITVLNQSNTLEVRKPLSDR